MKKKISLIIRASSKRLRGKSRILGKLLLILILPLIIYTCAVAHSSNPEWIPISEISNYASYTETHARLHLEVVADDDVPTSFTVDYEVSYYVQPGLNISARFNMITTGSEPNSGIGITLDTAQYEGPSYFFFEDGTSVEYETWKYSGTIKLYVSFRQTEFFPYDVYRTQWLYVWFNSTVYPRISLESVPSPGFELSLDDRSLVSRNHTWSEMSLGQRLFVGYPEVDPISFRLETYRSQIERIYFATFSYSIDLIIFWIPILTGVTIRNLADRIKILSSLSISVLAFMWTLTAIVQSMTCVQLFGILVVLGWSGAEVFNQCVVNTKMNGHAS